MDEKPRRARGRRATGENEWIIGVPTSRARYRKVRGEAQRRGVSMAAFVRQVLDEWFAAKGGGRERK